MDRGSGYQQRWFDTPETLNEKETCSKSYWFVSNFITENIFNHFHQCSDNFEIHRTKAMLVTTLKLSPTSL